ncbi:catalase family protein [Chengkuizengella axinellae]|uniref:Catalase family protein n=1 Tax=Chengkuizengella axinellae TaxID=3064388 RepID=A0ABT9J1M1_9BACL|nr:catalase family protein [Chengkuizengella sp. 2205SS18-9]MDP5275383.1 catalase family protein [Chengkuizengella sp. 2205SS18-9]
MKNTYSPTKFESIPADEASVIQSMQNLLQGKMDRSYEKGNTKRDAHPKHLALLKAEFEIASNLPEELKVGLFQKEKTYSAWIRVSNASGTPQPDKKKDFRGFAIKLMGVDGEKYLKEEKQTQDFVLMSHPTMPLGTAKLFHDAVYYALKWNPLVLLLNFTLTGKGHILKELNKGKKNHTSPLDIRYWSTTPYLFGENQVVKYSLVPTSSNKSSLPNELTDTYLTDNIEKHLREHDATFDFLVQFQKDPLLMPVEDAAVEWKETDSPFIKVATLKIPQQTFRTKERDELAEEMSFSPGHALLEHQPIGGINRARVEIYKNLSKFRHVRDNRKMLEPKD